MSIGIAIQGIVYVVSQTKGLEGLLILGCTSISQAMLPGEFLSLPNPLELLLIIGSLIYCPVHTTHLWFGNNGAGTEAATF